MTAGRIGLRLGVGEGSESEVTAYVSVASGTDVDLTEGTARSEVSNIDAKVELTGGSERDVEDGKVGGSGSLNGEA